MSFEQEWTGLVANARAEQATSMRLAGAGDGEGGNGGKGGKYLHVDAGQLRGHAGKADTVRGEFAKADNETMRETEQVPGTMKGFESDEAVKQFQERWRGQMKYLDGLFGSMGKALRKAAEEFKSDDTRTAAEMAALAKKKREEAHGGTSGPDTPPLFLNPNSPSLLRPGSNSPFLNTTPGPTPRTNPSYGPPLYGPYVPQNSTPSSGSDS
ncbi:type VII secretion target [Streptomyces axinellae]|uniref:Uncharacterized protein n=1 Tax=Streptomyces axinellae TaxID=552788 RepID=A0ABN3PZX8_9ACTN